jgi:hypothetical protein
MLKGAEKQPANKGKVRFVERTYHNRYNEESVYRSPNGKSGHYIAYFPFRSIGGK